MADPIFEALGLKDPPPQEPTAGWLAQQQQQQQQWAACYPPMGYAQPAWPMQSAAEEAAAAAMPWVHSSPMPGNLASQPSAWAEAVARRQLQEWHTAVKQVEEPVAKAVDPEVALTEPAFQEGAPAFVRQSPEGGEQGMDSTRLGADAFDEAVRELLLHSDSQGIGKSGRMACQWGAVGSGNKAKSPPATPPQKPSGGWEGPLSGTPAKISLRCGEPVSLADRLDPPEAQAPGKLYADPWLPHEGLGPWGPAGPWGLAAACCSEG